MSAGVEARITAFVDELVTTEPVEEAFNMFLVHKEEDAESDVDPCARWNALVAELVTAVTTENASSSAAQHQQAAVDSALAIFVGAMCQQRNPKTLGTLCSILEKSVGGGTLKARDACDAVLKYAKHDRNPAFWLVAFALVRRIIGGVDYKGVREIMKTCIEKVQVIPGEEVCPSVAPQLESVRAVLAYIFDRNAALLPGYFIVNEILKSYPDNPAWPHWTVVPMVSAFLNSFRPMAQMVTCINRHRMRPVVEATGKAHLISSWKLDPASLKFFLKVNLTYERTLPYGRDITASQAGLLRYVLRQGYSKELVSSVLGLQKPRKEPGAASSQQTQRYPALEEQLVQLFLEATGEGDAQLWRNLSSELIFFVLFQYISFPSFVNALTQKFKEMKEGRDDLMWSLLQFISGSIAKNSTEDFISVLYLMEVLYPDPDRGGEILAVPELTDPACVKKLAAAAVYIHLTTKASMEKINLNYPIPTGLSDHYKFLLKLADITSERATECLQKDFTVSVLCNTFSTMQEAFQAPVSALAKSIGGGNAAGAAGSEQQAAAATVAMPGTAPALTALGPTEPLGMELLDSLTVHAKMSLMHGIVTFIQKHVASKSSLALPPALVETCCRLLVYSELENLGVKGFLQTLLPLVFRESAWGVLNVLLEIFSYRLHHVQTHFRLNLLSHLQGGLVGGNHPMLSKNAQLSLAIESTALRLITGLGNSEVGPIGGASGSGANKGNTGGQQQQQQGGAGGGQQQGRGQQQQQQGSGGNVVLVGDSEELNRVVVLTLARAIHVNGLEQQSASWVKETLNSIMQKTPHAWPSQTLSGFPQIMQDFFKENPGPKETKSQLEQKVEAEYKVWTGTGGDAERLHHFSSPTSAHFLCVMWKMLMETEAINPGAYKVLEAIGCKRLTAHIRNFCDLMVLEFSKSGGSGHVSKCIEAMNKLIFKYNVVPLDRLILTMALRTNEGNEAQVCFFIIQLLLLKPPDFRDRLSEVVQTMSPEHQLIKDFHKTHLEYHRKFPERFGPRNPNASGEPDPSNGDPNAKVLPSYFANVCLRFIPVFDIVVHRFLELPALSKSLETLMDHIGVFYKFHQKPVTYLYNTLHYYESRTRDKASLKKKLICSVVGALKDVRPPEWCLTAPFLDYLASKEEWTPGAQYYIRLVSRLTHALQGRRPFPAMDWRFNEFPNEGAHATYATCVEVMGLPGKPHEVGAALLDVVLQSSYLIPRGELPDWINAIGIIISNLPEAYWEGLYGRLVSAISTPPLSQWSAGGTASSAPNPFKVFSFTEAREVFQRCSGTGGSSALSLLLAVGHSVFHHCGFTQIQTLPDLVREKFVPIVRTEEQLLFVIHLTGPFLQRLHSERYMRPLFDLAVQYYRMLAKVDREKTTPTLRHMDTICDLLYHVKYQFTGDSIRADAEKVERELSPPLQLRLRFIAGRQSATAATQQKQ